MGARMTAVAITAALFCLSVYFLAPLLKLDPSGWTVADGQVINRQAKRSRGHQRQYEILVTYEYTVDGRRYTGRRHTFAIASVERVSANSISQALERAGFPVGQKVRVFYNPKDPSKAVLNPHIGTGSKLMYVAVIGFSGLGFLAAVFGKVRQIR